MQNWINGYKSVTASSSFVPWLFYFGDAGGCPVKASSGTQCTTTWTVDNVITASWDSTNLLKITFPIPQIYTQDVSANARKQYDQWWYLSLVSSGTSRGPIRFPGVLTQAGACKNPIRRPPYVGGIGQEPDTCTYLDLDPNQAAGKLLENIINDGRTRYDPIVLSYLTDICWLDEFDIIRDPSKPRFYPYCFVPRPPRLPYP